MPFEAEGEIGKDMFAMTAKNETQGGS